MIEEHSVVDNITEFLGLSEKPKRKRAKKKVAKKAVRKAGRPAKAKTLAAQPKRMPKTKVLALRFAGDSVEMTFRDLRKLKTPLKYLDKRLPKLTKRQLRTAKVARDGQSIAWAEHDILVEVAHALRFEA